MSFGLKAEFKVQLIFLEASAGFIIKFYLEMNQSKSKPDTRLTHIGDLGVKLDEKTVTIRGRLHTSRAKRKQYFMVIRQQQVTVQCHVFVSEKVSKQMVKFASFVSKESIVDVEAVVKKVGDKIESCTQQDVELHVTQV